MEKKKYVKIAAPAKAADISIINYLRKIGLKVNGFFIIDSKGIFAILCLNILLPENTTPFELIDLVYRSMSNEKFGLFWSNLDGRAYNGVSW